MSPSNLRGVAYWVMAAILLFTGLGALAVYGDEEGAPPAQSAVRNAR